MPITALGKCLYYTVEVISHPVKHLVSARVHSSANFVNLGLNGLKAATLFAFRIKTLILNLICSLFLLIVIHMQKAQKKKQR